MMSFILWGIKSFKDTDALIDVKENLGVLRWR